MNDVMEEWFKRVDMRLKLELPPDMYERVMVIMISELRTIFEEQNRKLNEKFPFNEVR
jgi:hypothetical protein